MGPVGSSSSPGSSSPGGGVSLTVIGIRLPHAYGAFIFGPLVLTAAAIGLAIVLAIKRTRFGWWMPMTTCWLLLVAGLPLHLDTVYLRGDGPLVC
jgi:hypothetical protein